MRLSIDYTVLIDYQMRPVKNQITLIDRQVIAPGGFWNALHEQIACNSARQTCERVRWQSLANSLD